MFKQIFMLLMIWSISFGQSGLDILNTPTDARAAALGINLNPITKPSRILSHPEEAVTLSVWNWVADIQGATIGLGVKNTYLNIQAMRSGELEYRNDIPTEDPISTFEYSLFNLAGAHAYQVQNFSIGLGLELIYERTLNASATGLSLNLASAYQLNEHALVSGGLRHFGVTGKLDTASTALPSDAWVELDTEFKQFSILAEVNTGAYPIALGAAYRLVDSFELMAGLQVEPADPATRVHPSAGFTADWTNFTLAYSIYQLDHKLGPRHFFTLYWKY